MTLTPGGLRSCLERKARASFGGEGSSGAAAVEGGLSEACSVGSHPKAVGSAIHAAPTTLRNLPRVTPLRGSLVLCSVVKRTSSLGISRGSAAPCHWPTVSKVQYSTAKLGRSRLRSGESSSSGCPNETARRIVCLFGYLGEHPGELVHVRVEGALFADDILEGKALRLFAPYPNHGAGFAVG